LGLHKFETSLWRRNSEGEKEWIRGDERWAERENVPMLDITKPNSGIRKA
jgi:hypothetical protein